MGYSIWFMWPQRKSCLYKPVVGSGEAGYVKVLHSFRNDQVGGFARVIVVIHCTISYLIWS